MDQNDFCDAHAFSQVKLSTFILIHIGIERYLSTQQIDGQLLQSKPTLAENLGGNPSRYVAIIFPLVSTAALGSDAYVSQSVSFGYGTCSGNAILIIAQLLYYML